MDNLIRLKDELGRDVYFEFLDLISWKGDDFVVLLPVGSEDGEVASCVSKAMTMRQNPISLWKTKIFL